jgi:4-amino-4-deoxy-L-arabinose transferase-like glycosyltransferase
VHRVVSDRRFARTLAAIALAGLTLRLTYVIAVRHDVVGGDGFAYALNAFNLVDGKGFIQPFTRFGAADAIHPPGWATVLTLPAFFGFRKFFDLQIFACFVGTTSVVFIGLCGKRLAGARAGLIAAGIAAVYPGLWMFERELLSETLLILLTAVAILLSYRFIERPSTSGAVLLGVVIACLALTRAEQILLVPFLLLPAVLTARRFDVARRLGVLALAGVAIVVVISPWTLYNRDRFDRPVFLSAHMGVTMLVGNCDRVYSGSELGLMDISCGFVQPPLKPGADQSVVDYAGRKQALRYMSDHAGRLPVVVLAREGRAWSLYAPFQTAEFEAHFSRTRLWVHELAIFAFWALLPAAIAGGVVLHRRRVPLYPLLSFIVVIVVTVGITFGQPRYRAGAEVPILLLAAIAIDALLRRREHRAPELFDDDVEVVRAPPVERAGEPIGG